MFKIIIYYKISCKQIIIFEYFFLILLRILNASFGSVEKKMKARHVFKIDVEIEIGYLGNSDSYSQLV